SSGHVPSYRLLRLHAFLRRPVVSIVSIFTLHPLLLLYVFARYYIIEALSERPILYLRSFRYSSAPTAFGRIVAKSARRYGVVTTIVHESQPGSELMRHISVLDQAFAHRVSDEEWR